MCVALYNWLNSEGVQIQVTTSKNGISDIERFNRTVNEKLRIIGSESDIENRYTKFELILYIYNLKTKHNATNQIPADVFMYAGTPDYDTQEMKINRIEKLNEKRQDYEIDPKYKQALLMKSKTTNPFKKTETLKKVDEKHFEETNIGRKIVHYKSKFKKKKKISKSKYDDNSRQAEGNERTQEPLSENNNFLYNISNCNSTDNWTKY